MSSSTLETDILL